MHTYIKYIYIYIYIYICLLVLLDFSFDFSLFSLALALIIHNAYWLYSKSLNQITGNYGNDNNVGHISIKIIYTEKSETIWDEYR